MDERLLNDLLECSVCLERLDTSSKVLPCQHTFCKKCLEEIVQTHKELRCPECRVLVEIGIDELPPNVLLMRILEGMRNAPRRASTVVHSYQNETVTTAETSRTSLPSFSSHSRARSRSASRQVTQMSDLRQPYAVAKCDCKAEEPGDLNFKRGDVILLRRKVEHNWYQGECNGVLGVFPLSYVQVMIPLPSQHIPQCKALYDFSKCHEDEGCLHFSKGDVITVLRRIDENWAEGKLDDRIGIFPISFVEMNFLAKNLMKVSFSTPPGPSRDAPPTPTDDSVPLITKDGSAFMSNLRAQNNSDNLGGSSSPSSSSSTTSTATTSPTSSSESTTPSSPSNSPSSAQPAQSVAVKRHSFTLGAQPPPYHAPPAVHRHSAEILKPEETTVGMSEINSDVLNQHYQMEQRMTQSSHSAVSSSLNETPTRQSHHRKRVNQQEQNEVHREPQSLCLSSKQANGSSAVSFQRQSSLRVSKNSIPHSKSVSHPALPAMYIAVYPYKPQKTDELELKIGNVYTVIERCQDGWFKGTSHPNQKCGVFPGNYVTPVKSLPALQAQLRGMVHNSPRHETRASSEVRVSHASTKQNTVTSITTVSPSNGSSSRLAPPELPARSVSPVQSSASQKVSTTVWHVPTSEIQDKSISSTKSTNLNFVNGRVKNGYNESEGNAFVCNAAQKSIDVKPLKSSDKTKEKKEKGSVSLMRRLTSMKKSRSPPPTASSFSVDNPVFEDNGSPIFVPVAHARSDSCPSQLSYNTQSHTATPTNNHANIVGGSQRIKHKQRSSLQNQFSRTFETNSSSFSSKTKEEKQPVISHRKSSSLDTTMYDERSHKMKPADPPPRERYRCIAPYPPNSEFELELRVGDIIYVHKKREDGWYKGTLQRNGRTGLFPASFVESV